MKTRNVLIDTSIVLDGIENISGIDKNSNVFVTDVILRELDGNKGAEGAKGYNAREFFRQFNANKFQMLNELPFSKKSLDKNDTLTEGTISSGVHIYTIARKWYRSRDINDSRIIEIAKDYGLTLETLDQAQSARAKSEGVEVFDKKTTASYKHLNDTTYTSEVNMKVILPMVFAILLGLPAMVMANFAPWLVIPLLLIIVSGLLHLVMGDNKVTELIEAREKSIFKLTGSSNDSNESLSPQISTYNNESAGIYAGTSSGGF